MPPAEGTPIWFELNGTDPDAAQAFYEAVAGWRVAPSPMPEHGGYRIAEADGVPVAGIRRSMPEAPGLPGWAIYLATRDVDAVAARAVELGGAVPFGPVDIPHVGRFAMVSDPQGVIFAVMDPANPGASRAFGPVPSARSGPAATASGSSSPLPIPRRPSPSTARSSAGRSSGPCRWATWASTPSSGGATCAPAR